jgi:integrase/recombinase XerD
MLSPLCDSTRIVCAMADIHPLAGRGGDDRFSITLLPQFLAHLDAKGCSPNTVRGYGFDLRHFEEFLRKSSIDWRKLTTGQAAELLLYLRAPRTKRRGMRTAHERLSPATVNRILAALASFYAWAQFTGHFVLRSPFEPVQARGGVFVSDQHRPFLAGIARRSTLRRPLRVKVARRLPRPLSDAQLKRLFAALRCRRDIALVRLMLDGGLRPGEALGLQLTDISYSRRRITVLWREDHPRGVRAKSRTERVVDVHEEATLAALNDYVLTERPQDTTSPYVFLVGGRGAKGAQPLSYGALARAFSRACTRARIRAPGVTAHALRHTHATRMWEAGMRELTLQRRLGHASPESTRVYTRVSDRIVVEEYQRALGRQSS